MKKIYFSLFLCAYLAGVSAVLQAQNAPAASTTAPVANRSATKAEWEAAKNGIDYSGLSKAEIEKKKKAKNPATAQDSTTQSRPLRFNPSFHFLEGLGVLGQVTLIGLVIALVAGLFYMLIGQGLFLKNTAIKPQKDSFDISDIENNLHESDLQRYLRLALENQDYHLAVRIYYLAVLKQYSLMEVIKWKKDKTNTEYLTEVRRAGAPTYNDFRTTTQIFEYVCYGSNSLTHADFMKIKPYFERLNASLGVK